MGVLSNLLIASSLLTSLAGAAPFNKRDYVINLVTETAWTTVEVTTTVYDDNQPTAATSSSVASSSVVPASLTMISDIKTTLTPIVLASSVAAPASSVSSSPSAEGGLSLTTAPAATPDYQPATTLVPEVATTSSASLAVATSGLPVVAKAASSSGDCKSAGDACVGDVTYWDGGLGACGDSVDTYAEMAIAMPVGMMGSLSNTNPFCGASVTLVNPVSGTKVIATVKDKCMGCVDRSIDCTRKLFDAITDGKGDGRMKGIEWYFNN